MTRNDLETTSSSVTRQRGWLTLLGATMLFAGGCTNGIIVDQSWNKISNAGAVMLWAPLDDNMQETQPFISATLGNSPYVSFDSYAADGATSISFPGMTNSRQAIPPGNYHLYYTSDSVYASNAFAHTYDGSCTDAFTSKSDKMCESYYFQIITDNSPCDLCRGPGCTVEDLPLQNGTKIIQLCPAHGSGF